MNFYGEANWQGPTEAWKAFKDEVKAIPGVRYDPERKLWLVPKELKTWLKNRAWDKKIGLSWKGPLTLPVYPIPSEFDFPKLAKEYQIRTAAHAAEQRRHIINFEMGLGKTLTAILVMRLLNASKILVICPASVRGTWLEQFDEWWPGHPDIGFMQWGRGRKGLSKAQVLDRDRSYAAPIQIVSYSLSNEVKGSEWDFVVIDEAHRVKNPAAETANTVRHLVHACPNAAVVALTGTLIPNQPKDVWHLTHILWPNRFVRKGDEKKLLDPEFDKIPYSFLERYTNRIEEFDDETGEYYGTDFLGLNKAHEEEFRERLKGISTRVTKAEVAHELPPFMAQLVPILGKRSDLLTFDNWVEAQKELNKYGDEKLAHVIEWVQDALVNGNTHIVVFTQRRATVSLLANGLLKTGVPIYQIMGKGKGQGQTPDERNAMLLAASKLPQAIVIATMQSVEEGINGLANFTPGAFAELNFSPKTMSQVAGRLNRLSSKQPAEVYIFCVRGTYDEVIAKKLLDKLKDINQAIQPGDSEAKLISALGTKSTDEEFAASMETALVQYEEELY